MISILTGLIFGLVPALQSTHASLTGALKEESGAAGDGSRRALTSRNLLAVVEPNVINADLQNAVEKVGLFYPPDPASLNQSSIGGNVAECAGGPRAFKYGTTKRYILALEAVLPTGEIIDTGSKAVKNVVGYDLTQLLVGSEGTLAIITKITVRLVPKPQANATMLATFDGIRGAVDAVSEVIRRRVVPAALELIDGDSLATIRENLGADLVPPGTGAALIVEVDGTARGAEEDLDRVVEACRVTGAKVSCFPLTTMIVPTPLRLVVSLRGLEGSWT